MRNMKKKEMPRMVQFSKTCNAQPRMKACLLVMCIALTLTSCGIRKRLELPEENGHKAQQMPGSVSPVLGVGNAASQPYEPPERSLLPLQKDNSGQTTMQSPGAQSQEPAATQPASPATTEQ
jgi:hypothetical protein